LTGDVGLQVSRIWSAHQVSVSVGRLRRVCLIIEHDLGLLRCVGDAERGADLEADRFWQSLLVSLLSGQPHGHPPHHVLTSFNDLSGLPATLEILLCLFHRASAWMIFFAIFHLFISSLGC